MSPSKPQTTVPMQTTVDGREEPLQAPQEPCERHAQQTPLFTAPQTIRGQLSMND